MKGKKPTRKEKEIISERKLKVENWLILKRPTGEIHIQHRKSKKVKILYI